MSLVTVFMTFNAAEAGFVCSRLDAAGFHPELKNEGSVLSIDGYSLAAGGIWVQVPEEEAVSARELVTDKETQE